MTREYACFGLILVVLLATEIVKGPPGGDDKGVGLALALSQLYRRFDHRLGNAPNPRRPMLSKSRVEGSGTAEEKLGP